MTANGVFANPTVKQVIFQITFPNLFYIESSIGDLQKAIMQYFPDSKLIIRRNFIIAAGEKVKKSDDAPDDTLDESAQKIWTFISKSGVELHVMRNSLDLSSESHKTYDHPSEDGRFRDAISVVLDPFFEITGIQQVQRVGLRYIDDCPIFEKDTKWFRSWYKSAFPLGRFKLEQSTDMRFSAVVNKGNYRFRYAEALFYDKDELKYVLDFDGSAQNVPFSKCLPTTDKLHKMIHDEWVKSLKAPVFDYMREGKK